MSFPLSREQAGLVHCPRLRRGITCPCPNGGVLAETGVAGLAGELGAVLAFLYPIVSRGGGSCGERAEVAAPFGLFEFVAPGGPASFILGAHTLRSLLAHYFFACSTRNYTVGLHVTSEAGFPGSRSEGPGKRNSPPPWLPLASSHVHILGKGDRGRGRLAG